MAVTLDETTVCSCLALLWKIALAMASYGSSVFSTESQGDPALYMLKSITLIQAKVLALSKYFNSAFYHSKYKDQNL